MKIFKFTLLLLISGGYLSGQNKVILENSIELPVFSKIIDDSLFIQLSLPPNYGNSEEKYPIIYLLDSDPSFGMVKGICWWLKFERLMPDVIIVGIAYKEDWWQKRSRDYTPSKDQAKNWGEWPIAGGAKKFLNFIENELNPVLREYSINWENKTIIGHSFGGIFVTYSLLYKPELFDSYISISPALIWDNDYLSKMNYEPLESKANESYVFTAIGEFDSEKIITTWNEFNKLIEGRNLHKLKWEVMNYKNQTHSSVLPIAISDGLRKVFSKKN